MRVLESAAVPALKMLVLLPVVAQESEMREQAQLVVQELVLSCRRIDW
jgi:hypothetical protein